MSLLPNLPPNILADYRALRRLWDAKTGFHLTSTFYDVAGFVAGRSSLNAPGLYNRRGR